MAELKPSPSTHGTAAPFTSAIFLNEPGTCLMEAVFRFRVPASSRNQAQWM